MVEPQIVVLDVAGSSPVDHPILRPRCTYENRVPVSLVSLAVRGVISICMFNMARP